MVERVDVGLVLVVDVVLDLVLVDLVLVGLVDVGLVDVGRPGARPRVVLVDLVLELVELSCSSCVDVVLVDDVELVRG